MEHCVHTKDHLLNLLNENGTDEQIIENCSTVVIVLEHTEGLWIDTHYCYKAAEIAQRVIDRLNSIDQSHHARKARLQTTIHRCYSLITKYRNLQYNNPRLLAS